MAWPTITIGDWEAFDLKARLVCSYRENEILLSGASRFFMGIKTFFSTEPNAGLDDR